MNGPEIETLVRLLAKLPGLGPRSARRAALQLLKKREATLLPLIDALTAAAEAVKTCGVCGNLDTRDPCGVCADDKRDRGLVCVVEDVADMWAIERTAGYRGVYHVLGGTLSALDGRGPQDLNLASLVERCAAGRVREVVLALNATVDGQTTAHYVADRLKASGAEITRLAHGVPVGGELDYLDDGTLVAALRARRAV
ncbi:MAG: recombination protein RecR [Azospirillum sp.]|nr:recombination protein RecR [Azospirillum sp.]